MTWFQLVKSLHVIGVIAWMAGMFYLPRLYAYHAAAAPGSDKSETFKVMERRLLRAIINPAMVAAWLFGLILVFVYPAEAGIDWGKGWVWAKAAAVIAMSGLHGFYSRWRKDFALDRNTRPARFYKIWNEVPTVLMIVIVIMVIGKPF
ncbi:MAG: protoporphyrinogen oxidase HemJ [Rhodospirillaceae bacterium]|nr:protoporphyrinogen oxidase HemJ [Rhodospirillaceae bacterium]